MGSSSIRRRAAHIPRSTPGTTMITPTMRPVGQDCTRSMAICPRSVVAAIEIMSYTDWPCDSGYHVTNPITTVEGTMISPAVHSSAESRNRSMPTSRTALSPYTARMSMEASSATCAKPKATSHQPRRRSNLRTVGQSPPRAVCPFSSCTSE